MKWVLLYYLLIAEIEWQGRDRHLKYQLFPQFPMQILTFFTQSFFLCLTPMVDGHSLSHQIWQKAENSEHIWDTILETLKKNVFRVDRHISLFHLFPSSSDSLSVWEGTKTAYQFMGKTLGVVEHIQQQLTSMGDAAAYGLMQWHRILG